MLKLITLWHGYENGRYRIRETLLVPRFLHFPLAVASSLQNEGGLRRNTGHSAAKQKEMLW